jgi:hypothetical protein
MTLEEPWLFGTARGQKILVAQTAEVTLNPAPAKPKKDEPEKGKDIPTEPRVLAHLADGSPALILNPVGDGEVLWAPHRLQGNENVQALQLLYSAIASHMQGALIQVHSSNGKSTTPVRVALRRSPKGTWLIGLFSDSGESTPATVEANHFAGVALDLATEKELPLKTRGNRSTIETTIPSQGWQIIALGESRKVLDEERFAPRAKVKIR